MNSKDHDYTVHLDQVFQGPMDLLLHLVREQEVDIQDIELTPVIDGYLRYLRELEQIDIELASEFVLMAATLMSIKSRSLLPRQEIDLEAELDPRDELIQRLIEYRRFREASLDLARRFHMRERLYPRGNFAEPGAAPELDWSEITRWNLLSEFSRLMRETRGHQKLQIETDGRPLRYYVRQLVDWLKVDREASLRSLVRRSAAEGDRHQLVGSFCALLELVKLGVLRAWQPNRSADITLVLRDDAGEDLDQFLAHAQLPEDEVAAIPTPGAESGSGAEDSTGPSPEAESSPLEGDPLRN